MTEMNMVEAIRSTLAAEMARDERVMILGQDVGRLGGVFRATEGLQERFGEERVVDMPLAEGAIIGSAVGLAVSGLVPIAEIQFLGFSVQAFHQIEGQLARMRYRSGGRHAMQVVVRAPFGGNVRTPELHSDAMESKYAHTPGLKIAVPSTARDAKGLLTEAIRDPDPVLYLEPLRGYRLQRDEVPDESYTVPFGKARGRAQGQRRHPHRVECCCARCESRRQILRPRRASRARSSTCAPWCRSTRRQSLRRSRQRVAPSSSTRRPTPVGSALR